jgi:hypothetical protein
MKIGQPKLSERVKEVNRSLHIDFARSGREQGDWDSPLRREIDPYKDINLQFYGPPPCLPSRLLPTGFQAFSRHQMDMRWRVIFSCRPFSNK